jgi:hypothetical protein
VTIIALAFPAFGLLPVVAGVVLDLLQQPPVGLVRGVIREDVEDEALLDRLTHGVAVERLELPVAAPPAEQLQRLGLGRGGEGEGGEGGQPPAPLHLGQDRVLQLLLGRRGGGLLGLGLLQGARGEHGLEAPGALPRLRGVRLVHDQREALAWQLADLPGDHRELLERGDDDRLAGLERLLELARGGVDVLHHAQRLLELAHGGLELAVQHASVGDHHDRVEDPPVPRVVQRRQLVGEPGDGEALAASRRVLDEVALARPHRPRICDEPAHAVELLVAREDHEAPAGLAAPVVLLLDLVDELAHEVEYAVARPGLLPEVRGCVARPRGWHGRVAGPAELALVEGQEARPRPVELGGDEDQVGVDGEVRQAAAVGEEGFARVTGGPVLANRVLDVLAVEEVLQLGGEEGDAVQEQHQVEGVLAGRAVAELADGREEVRRVQPARVLVEAARRPEVREAELAAGILETVAQHVERAAPPDLGGQALEELLPHRRTVMLLELLPLPGLGGEDEVHHVARQQAERAVVLLRATLAVAAWRPLAVWGRRLVDGVGRTRAGVRAVPEQAAFDGLLERSLGDVGGHSGSVPSLRTARYLS